MTLEKGQSNLGIDEKIKSKARMTVATDQNAQAIDIFCKIGIAAIATRPMPMASVIIPVTPGANILLIRICEAVFTSAPFSTSSR